MPRIPEGQFDQNPSTRVGTPNVQLAPDALNAAAKEAAGLVGAMAQLQDQTERTEAYQKANDIKSQYLQKKAVYEAALQTVNGKGHVDYFDPSDSNPDVSKRRRIQRPVQEMYKEMVDSYEESKKELNGIARGDIASDLARQYVGDDLIQTQIKTNKLINRQREKETLSSVTENIELNMSSAIEKISAPDATEDTVNLTLAHMNNKIARDIGAASGILGAENTTQVLKLKDRAFATAATQIISSGVTNTTVKAADQFIAKIKDPSTKSLAMTRLENIKKTTSEVKSITLLNQTSGLDQQISAASHLKDEDYVAAINTFDKTMNVYTDPKYNSIVTDDLKKQKAGSLLSTALASRQSLELMDVDMTFLVDPSKDVDESTMPDWAARQASRDPSGNADGNGPKMRALKEQIRQELEASGLKAKLKGDTAFENQIIDQTIAKMRNRRATLKDNLPDMVAAKYPNISPQERLERINRIAETQALGSVSLVGKKDQQAFKENFATLMAKDPTQALNLFNQTLAPAGPAIEGESSYRRAMAIDLAGKEPSLAYLIPMADADEATKYDMIKDATIFNRVITETDASKNTFNESFESVKHTVPALQPLFRNNPSLYDGIKQMAMHRAASKLANKTGGTKKDVPTLMTEAIKEVGQMYTSVGLKDGSSILALNRGKNYGNVAANVLESGMETAKTLPNLSREQKVDIINRYQAKIGAKMQINEHTPDDHLNFILSRQVKIEPDGRHPNVHVLKIEDGVLTDREGNRITVSVDDIVNYGTVNRSAVRKQYGGK